MTVTLNLKQAVTIAEIRMLIKGFASFYAEVGFSKTDSKVQAENTVIGIQGALVLSRGLDSKDPFKRQLKQIEQLALAKINSN
ncbi:hypothetical protein [Polynucleobacter sphagniphilus]|uniref:hypothetical protein n=1 Tax=Polynucleobacter sphagniphilus TaxID=1743169 RepID=UPI002404A7A5|nr:hypothetical protein [Polynucleobacter sphagniphilus]MDF9789296.1 hypothetical protein [Polynucleobacter sphagniphilus]